MSDKFQVLNEAEHVLQRSGMYVGSTSLEEVSGYFDGEYKTLKIVPALIKIINEIIDNSVDEYVRTNGKHANRIEVAIENDLLRGSFVRVHDNGRGIPVEKLADGEYRPLLAWTRARAGSNFSDDANRVTMGMNGVGAFCTNVFSTSFVGTTCDGSRKMTVTSKNNMKDVKSSIRKSSVKFTEVEFFPDLDRLGGLDEITEDHITYIRERLTNLGATYESLLFILNGVRIRFTNPTSFAKRFSSSPIVLSDDNGLIAFASSGDSGEFRLHSYVNGLYVRNGGSHVDYILSGLCDELRPMIKRKHKVDVLPNQIKQHLLLITVLRGVKNLKFDSQTKERITNTKSELESHLGSINFKNLAKRILDTPDIIDPMIQSILAKKAAADRLAIAREQKKLKKTKIAKHVEAQGKNPNSKVLFISEGDSAAGRIASLRDSKTVQTVGGYPLRGKVLNTYGMKPTDIVKNKELSELMAVIGLEFGKPAKNLNYGKIAIMTDMDTDGDAIACLLVNFFSHWKELFEDDRIYRVLSPLIIARKGKKSLSFHTMKEYENSEVDSTWTVDYYKGLGSLDKNEYRKMINDPVLVPIKLDDSGMLDIAFGPESEKRKEWLMA